MTRTYIRAGLIAGLIGGALESIYNIAALVGAVHLSLAQAATTFFQFVAAQAVGKPTAFSSPSYAWVGLPVQFVIAIVWALVYAYIAQTRPNATRYAFASGLAFGLIVWAFMQVVQLSAGLPPPTPASIDFLLLDHVVFYAIPVAYTVNSLTRPRTA
ncbi:MAG: hypothetical protein JO101_01230 [Candidatus Eremiobacteraeota bacterium]|nr:hypothetical protein [Candidatus Eremiobacteraeota bacterium]MBV8353914.1 hypothetical protein [Candidatus Eremiobacteraeota bacterium]